MRRELVEKPEDWAWSSFRHYATGEEGVVEIESESTERKRERMGMPVRLKVNSSPVTFGGAPADNSGPSPPPNHPNKSKNRDLLGTPVRGKG